MSNKSQLVVVSEWWDYYPIFIDPCVFELLYSEVSNTCKIHKINVYGKQYNSKRMSCYFTSMVNVTPTSKNYNYGDLPSFDWEVSPTISIIKEMIEKMLNTHYDYCLVHIYRNGNDSIGWHNDKEALNTDIASVSLGATRKFRFREIDNISGWHSEIILNSGDLLHMKTGCQTKYKHCVPVEKTVKESRINLTFRKFE
jgi:alkylated DNA repair dioxygenase AlkB